MHTYARNHARILICTLLVGGGAHYITPVRLTIMSLSLQSSTLSGGFLVSAMTTWPRDAKQKAGAGRVHLGFACTRIA